MLFRRGRIFFLAVALSAALGAAGLRAGENAAKPGTAPAMTAEEAKMVGGRDFVLTMTKPETRFPQDARDLDAIRKRGTLYAGQYQGDNPPFSFYEQGTGKLIGFDVDLAQSLAKDIGVKLVLNRSYPTFQSVADAVETGEVDVGITNLSVTEKRKQQVSFSEPYLVGYIALLIDLAAVEKKLPGVEIIGPSDLDRPELTGLVEAGSSYEGEIKSLFPKAKVLAETHPPGSRRYEAVLQHKAEFMLRDSVSMIGDILPDPAILTDKGGPLTYVNLLSTQDPYAVAIAKSAPELVKFVDRHIEKFEDVPTTSSIFKQYVKR